MFPVCKSFLEEICDCVIKIKNNDYFNDRFVVALQHFFPRNDCKEFDNALTNFLDCCQFHKFLQVSDIAERSELKAAMQLFKDGKAVLMPQNAAKIRVICEIRG
jgi:hypothetical protein